MRIMKTSNAIFDPVATNEKNLMKRDLIVFTYALFVGLFATALFLYAFFPIKYHDNDVSTMLDIPEYVEHVRIKRDELYGPLFKRVVIMVVDALRWDFLTQTSRNWRMPLTTDLMKKNSSCLLQAKSDPPTVTMPRIKAMMSGAASSFIDVALNFGNTPVSGDSFLLQAKNHGHKMHFYGDDTWLKIFPGLFEQHEGTVSFFVNDFTQVDDNVTRNVVKELDKEDWSVLILHYLGLDHIGHVVGPFAPQVKPKLEEMDKIIGMIEAKLEKWKKDDLLGLFVVCGDHGMKDSGGHGGSSPEETLVPFLVFGATCPLSIDKPNEIRQLDVASTLSVLLGLPIPSSSIGSISPKMLNERSKSSKLFILYYNAQQLLKHFRSTSDYKTSQAYKYYEEAVALHVGWLSNEKDNRAVEAALDLYDKAFQEMKDILIHTSIDYDLQTMIIAIIFMGPIILLLADVPSYSIYQVSRTLQWAMGTLVSYLVLIFMFETEDIVFLPKVKSIILNAMIFAIVMISSSFAGNMSLYEWLRKRISRFSLSESLFPLGMIVHIFSLTSSSFVEEEHQTWYFFWSTMLILMMLNSASKFSQLSIELLGGMVVHRVLRKLNSTGNKYANAPDIADWLTEQENKNSMTILLLFALGLLVVLGYVCEEKKYKMKCAIMHIGASICIYLRHMANKTVTELPFDFQSRGIMEVRVYWILIAFYTLLWTYRLYQETDKMIFRKSCLRFLLQLWIIVSCVLHKPHNVILLPVQIIISHVIHKAFQRNKTREDSYIYMYLWIGNVFYFYQGNSNSLATIDVAAGYVGMESYRPFLTAIFMLINTYSAPVLAYFTLIYYTTFDEFQDSFSKKILTINRNCALWRLLPMAVYTIIVTAQRFHLFVWTVFSPKLIYEAVHCAVIFTIIFLTQSVCFLLDGK